MPILERIELAPEDRRRFASWLHEQLHNTKGDRSELEAKWRNRYLQWRAAMPTTQADHPWPGACNVEFPLTGIHSEPVYADFMQTLHTPEDYWTPVARRDDRVQHAGPLREGMTSLDRRYINMRAVNSRALLDNNILGTGVYKNHWIRERKSVRDYRPDGTIGKVSRLRSQPLVQAVPLQYFYIPADAWAIDPDAPFGGAQWCAEKFYLTKSELRVRATSDDRNRAYDDDAVEIVLKHIATPDDLLDETIREESKYSPAIHERIELFEVWARYDTDDDGVDEDVVAIFHKDSQTVLRVQHNPFVHGRRPYHITNYLPSFGLYGIGMAEKEEWAQTTLTMLVNGAVNNSIVANSRMYGVPLGMNLNPNEPIFAGKLWPLGPDENVQEIRMGDIHPSLPMLINSFMQWSEQVQGMPEIRQGNIANLPSRTPATTIMSALGEGKKRFDMILNNIRNVHGDMGLRILQNVADAYRDPLESTRWATFFMNALGQKDGSLVLEVLGGSMAEIEESFGITVTATSAINNKEAEKQSMIAMMQVVLPMYGQLVQTAMMMQQLPPGSPAYETAAATYTGGVELIERMLEKFDIQNPSQYLGNMEAVAAQLTGQGQQGMMMPPGMLPGGGAQPGFGGGLGSPVPPGAGGLGALYGY